MKKVSEIAAGIFERDAAADPKLTKIDVQVRTGGHIVPPSWLRNRPNIQKKHSAFHSSEPKLTSKS